jgi:hypothetical protein
LKNKPLWEEEPAYWLTLDERDKWRNVMAARKSYRISKQAILDGKDSRHKAGFGPSRADLFLKSKDLKAHPILRVLPQFKPRGPKGYELYYFSEGGHWIDVQNEQDDKTHPERKTCFEYMKEEQPKAFQELLKTSEWDEKKCQCFFCELIDRYQGNEDELPANSYGVTFRRDVTHNMPIILPEDEYGDDDTFLVKIFPARITVIDALNEELDDNWPDLLDPVKGNWVKIWLDGTSYKVSVQTRRAGKIWLADWEKRMPNLETDSPNYWTYEQQKAYVEEVWPQLTQPTVRRPQAKKTTPKKSAQSQVTSRKKTAKKKGRRR